MSLNKLLDNLTKVNNEEWLRRKAELPKNVKQPSVCKHVWQTTGGRSCPFVVKTDYIGLDYCSMTVYKCKDCGDYDYGYEGGPGWKECEKCPRSGLMVREYNNAEI